MTNQDNFRENIQEYHLSVSQFAKLCGTTRDTLRHYYENDLLIPRVDPKNGYHYYSASQVSSYFFINMFRQAGCSIREIHALIHDSSKEKIRMATNAKVLDLQRELYTIHNKIASLQLGLWLLEKYDQNRHHAPFLETLANISVAKTPIAYKAHAHHASDIAKDLSRHLASVSGESNLSVFPTGVTMSYEDLCRENYIYNHVISLSILPADYSKTFPLPSQTVVSCYHDHHAASIEGTYQDMVRFVQEKNLKACSDLHIISLMNLYDIAEKHTYFKYLFLCVET